MDKGRLTLQWHINEQCNQRCTHCYQKQYSHPGLPLDQLKMIAASYISLLDEFNARYNLKKYKGHINITGGEPFLRPDFFEILGFLSENNLHFSYAILTNGSLITDENAKRLKKLNPSFIQLSLEGNRETHDSIRGENNFETVTNALKILNKHKIKTYISFTAHSDNYTCFPEVAKTGRKYKIAKVWADRLVPEGKTSIDLKTLSVDECNAFFKIMNRERKRKSLFSKTKIEMSRALMFFETGNKPYHCSAGDTLLCVLHDGTLLPCRRLPVNCGDVLKNELSDLYFNYSFMQQLRDKQLISEGCEKCSWHVYCRGGAKCISYALQENAFKADPGCKIAALFSNNQKFTS